MRGTLSQTRQRTDARRRCAFVHPLRHVFAMAIAAGALGCSPAEPGSREETASQSAENGQADTLETEGEAGKSKRFTWPEDPSHPVLEIVVEGPDLEGRIRIELMPELAPSSVIGLIELAASGFYDGTTFHRVIPDFMIQGGDPYSRDRDPMNDGAGPPGRPLPDEFSEAPFLRGVVGMGNKGTAGSTSTQLFIMQADKPGLNGRYNAIGRVLEGLDLVDAIAGVTTDRSGRWGPRDRPIENVSLRSVRPIGQLADVRSGSATDSPAPSIPARLADAQDGPGNATGNE